MRVKERSEKHTVDSKIFVQNTYTSAFLFTYNDISDAASNQAKDTATCTHSDVLWQEDGTQNRPSNGRHNKLHHSRKEAMDLFNSLANEPQLQSMQKRMRHKNT